MESLRIRIMNAMINKMETKRGENKFEISNFILLS